LEQLAAFCKGPEYPAYLKKLIVQGLIKIEEQVVEIQARAEDKAIVSKIVSSVSVRKLTSLSCVVE
jgi:vacuolar-type H+-ATPase subunit E/Vma4